MVKYFYFYNSSFAFRYFLGLFLCFIFACPTQGLATSSMEMGFVYLVLEGISHMVI
jgi:multidrug transporter EmrE-like cation transporter